MVFGGAVFGGVQDKAVEGWDVLLYKRNWKASKGGVNKTTCYLAALSTVTCNCESSSE